MLRIAILSLVAATVMPIPQGIAEDNASRPQISANRVVPPLIRVVEEETQECRRQCDAELAACLARVRDYGADASDADKEASFQECTDRHDACYRAC